MLRSHKLTGTLYIGIGLLSTAVGIWRSHDVLAGVGVIFFCIGASLLASAAQHASTDRPTRDNAHARRHRRNSAPG